jgi:hypothetical protein
MLLTCLVLWLCLLPTEFGIKSNKYWGVKIKMPKFLLTTTHRFERIGQILHARLRMNGSSLNEHLFLRNLVDSPNSLVGGTTSHYYTSVYTFLKLLEC